MTQNRDELLVHPLFYDALSGEFEPQIDPEERLHTLGRLAYATFIKGDSNVEDALPFRTFYTYEPSWAQGVDVRISSDAPDAKLNHMLLTTRASKARLYIQDTAKPQGKSGLHLESNTLRIRNTFNLALGSDLALARRRVTEAAQAFFEEAV